MRLRVSFMFHFRLVTVSSQSLSRPFSWPYDKACRQETMRRFATVLSRSIAFLSSILFILSLVLVLVLVDIQFILLNAETYKHALLEHNVYEQLPALMAEDSSAIRRFLGDSCTETPLVCAMKGGSSEQRFCLMSALGEAAYL